jgi:hypothetical protein
MARSVAVIEADIAKYEARLDALLDPDRASRMKHGDRELARGDAAGMEQSIRRRILELKAELARARGGRSPRRPVGV